MARVLFRSVVPRPANDLFDWHCRPGAFGRLVPPGQPVRLQGCDLGLAPGDRRTLKIGYGPISQTWVADHDEWVSGRQFRDVQSKGPFRRWEHTHRCLPATSELERESECAVLEDQVEFDLLGLPKWALRLGLGSTMADMFSFRHRRTYYDMLRWRPTSATVVVSGGSGLAGQALIPFLQTQGFRVLQLVRRVAAHSGEVAWGANPASEAVGLVADELSRLLDGQPWFWIHLSGHGVVDGNWGRDHRRKMWTSRMETTRAVVEICARMSNRPQALLCASGISMYPDASIHDPPWTDSQDFPVVGTPGADLTEAMKNNPKGQQFLAEICRHWEAQANRAHDLGVRSVQLRLGAIISPAGGALGQMLLPFRLGLGATINGGAQPFSWIGLEDVLGAILHILRTPTISGPVNVVSPQLITFREFADCLAGVLRRPRLLDAKASWVRPILGDKVELLVSGAPVFPKKLQESGFQFLLPSPARALRHELAMALDVDNQFSVTWD